MEDILNTDNAGQLHTKLNANFGSSSGSGIQEIESTDYANQLIEKVNDNFELIEGSGPSQKFRFLHISDLHGYADALEECVDMMADDDRYKFLIITGDLTKYSTNNITTDIANAIDDIPSGKLLICAGNHDVWDLKSGNQANVTAWLQDYMGNSVTWGDSNNVGGYWYKDFAIGSNTLRIISLDQYETAYRNNKNHVTYTQAQVNWVIARLKELTANDYFIILCHHPVMQNVDTSTTSESTGQADIHDEYAEDIATIDDSGKLFVSAGLYGWTNPAGVEDINLWPRIIKAYMHKQSLSLTHNNYGGNANSPDITISEDFSAMNHNPATFLFYAGGHLHGDVCYYLPDESEETSGDDWSDQLMLHITAASRSVNYAYMDDLGGYDSTNHRPTPTPTNPSSETYRINEVVLDFEDKTIRVIRYGDKNTSDGRVRTAITFPFKKN